MGRGTSVFRIWKHCIFSSPLGNSWRCMMPAYSRPGRVPESKALLHITELAFPKLIFFFFFKVFTWFYLFIYLFLAVLGLRFCARAFSSCGKRGPLFIAVHGPLTIAASLVGSTGSRRTGSVVVAHGPSCSTACGIFPDQGSNLRPLHWQADSQPLCHQGSPHNILYN